jgi:AhpD family alkylhydroperoxidase
MPKLEVYDPPMCCSSGACGPSVDPVLPRFAADLKWLEGQGVEVARFNLAQQPGAFVSNDAVKRALEENGDGLPLIIVDGRIVSRAVYPTRKELAALVGITVEGTPSLCSPAVEELVGIGAAIAANCMPCLKYHTDKARSLGVSNEDMARAVAIGNAVKQVPARAILNLADRFLNGPVQEAVRNQSCCTPAPGKPDSKCC